MVNVSLLLLLLTLSACQAITLVEPEIDGPARMPASGAVYTYSYKATGTADSTIERVSMQIIPGQDFIAVRTVDSLVVGADTLHVRDDGDLESANENEVYPIGTLGSYAISSHSPTVVNGGCTEADVESEFKYDGSDRLMVGDSSYLCSRIKTNIVITPDNGEPTSDISITYWYSSRLAYFVLIRSNSSSDKNLNFERKLISVK